MNSNNYFLNSMIFESAAFLQNKCIHPLLLLSSSNPKPISHNFGTNVQPIKSAAYDLDKQAQVLAFGKNSFNALIDAPVSINSSTKTTYFYYLKSYNSSLLN